MSDEHIGRTLAGRFQILAKLGSGGAGAVYKAIDLRLGRTVALKFWGGSFEESEEARDRFLREAAVAAKLTHPNVLTVYDVGWAEGRPYLATEFVEGGSLRDALDPGQPLILDQALAIARQLAAALSYIHGAGLVHRDLKPSNILLRPSDGRVLIADLALGLQQHSLSVTRIGTILGTPAYMSPEQARGERVDARSDLFAFGVVIYQMLTGRRPFESESISGLLYQIVAVPAPSPLTYNKALPLEIESVVLRSLEKSPTARYPSAQALIDALERAASPDKQPTSQGSVVRLPPVDASVSSSPATRDETTGVTVPFSEPLPWAVGFQKDAFPAWLLVVTGTQSGQQFPVRDGVKIGRHPSNDVVLSDFRSSSFQARIDRRGDGYYLVDLGSRNGTMVNGLRITEQRLVDRDEVRIGNVSLLFIEAVTEQELTADAKRRLREFQSVWSRLESAAREGDHHRFEEMSAQLLEGLLREAIGYRVEHTVPLYRGIAGRVVHSPMMWIRHSRFPVLLIAYDTRRPDILPDVTKQVEMAKAGGYFALLVVVPTQPRTGNESSTLKQKLADSVYRHDYVVLDRDHLASVISHGSSQRLIEIILEEGIDISTLSPYVVRGPVPEAMFFGRERELKAISQTIQSHDYALVGGRRIGKSSILLKLNRVLGYDQRFDPLYVNCEDKFDAGDLLRDLGEALGASVPLAEPRQLRTLLTERRKSHEGQPVFLLDEVDELLMRDVGTSSATQLFKTLRAASHEGLCRFVFSGSRSLRQHLHDPHSPFFNFCDEMRLSMLDGRNVAEIVTKPLQQLGFELPDREALIDRAIVLTGGHPNLVQWLCDRLVKTANGRRIDVALLEQVAGDPVFCEHFLETVWGDATSLERLVSLVVDQQECEFETLFEKVSALGMNDRPLLLEALRTLELFSVLERRGSRYRLLLPEFLSIAGRARDIPAQIAQLVGEGSA